MPPKAQLPYLIAMKVKGSNQVSYYGGGGSKHGFRWVSNPRDGVFLHANNAQVIISQCRKSHSKEILFERVDVHDSIRLYVLQGRRGDTRSLQSPEGAGVPTLTARRESVDTR